MLLTIMLEWTIYVANLLSWNQVFCNRVYNTNNTVSDYFHFKTDFLINKRQKVVRLWPYLLHHLLFPCSYQKSLYCKFKIKLLVFYKHVYTLKYSITHIPYTLNSYFSMWADHAIMKVILVHFIVLFKYSIHSMEI